MADGSPHRLRSVPWMIGLLALGLVVVAMALRNRTEIPQHFANDSSADDVHNEPSNLIQTSVPAKAAGATSFVTAIRRPLGPPVIELDQADPQGRVGSIACSTCHSVREPNYANRTPADLDQFHQNMPMAHGKLACYACHNPADADTLRLADSTAVDYPDVMTLCAQCHGPQARDYEHGAHGGMNGYWDLSRGPRTRNNCIDCHDPHVPKFPSMQPTFKPRDRFLTPPVLHAGTDDPSHPHSEISGE